VAEELARDRVRDERALVADDRIVEARLFEVRTHGLEHPSRHDDHVRAGGTDCVDRSPRARAEHGVLRDQRAVEIDREGGDAVGEVGRED
jgi:hypothetical protein